MTRTILILLIGFLSSIVAGCSDTNLTHDIPLVPRPAQIVPGSGNYLFSGKTVFAVENEEQAEAVRWQDTSAALWGFPAGQAYYRGTTEPQQHRADAERRCSGRSVVGIPAPDHGSH